MRTLFVILMLATLPALGQKKIKTLEISDTIVSMSIDRPGDFYLVTKSGQFQKFDQDGHLIILYKNHSHVPPTLFDPYDGSRLFTYYRDAQEYSYLNPSFEITSSYRIDSAFVIQPWLICSSGDHKLWVLDEADHSLKKINVRTTEVEVEVVIDLTLIKNVRNVSSMRDYQGFVFLLHKNHGIYVFNSMGKHIRTIEVPGIHSFNFLGEELYYHEGSKLKFFDLFTTETRELDLTGKQGEVIVGEQRLFLVHSTSVDIFEFKP
jgi:hypothetical protein